MSYPKWPKIPRISKINWSITEKIDGTNGIIQIVECPDRYEFSRAGGACSGAVEWVGGFAVFAGSRTRWLLPERVKKGGDNFGFAQWVHENVGQLVQLLGVGTHYGEWWGQGIQRGYGLDHKRFSLFIPWRYPHLPFPTEVGADQSIVTRVPIISIGSDITKLPKAMSVAANSLAASSYAVPGWDRPEGYVLQIGEQRNKFIVHECDEKRGDR